MQGGNANSTQATQAFWRDVAAISLLPPRPPALCQGPWTSVQQEEYQSSPPQPRPLLPISHKSAKPLGEEVERCVSGNEDRREGLSQVHAK